MPTYKRKYAKRNYNYKKKTYKRNTRKRRQKYSDIQSAIIKQPGVVCADRTFVRMYYVDQSNDTLGTNGNNFMAVRYRGNSVFDPNPALGGASIPGYNSMTGLYRFYRVRGCAINLTLANQEAFPSNIVVFPTNTDVAPSYSRTFLQEMMSNFDAKWKCVSAKGGADRVSVKAYLSTKKIAGSKTALFDDNYASLSNGNPVNQWYWNLGCYSLDGSNYTAALMPMEVRLTFYVEWYERNYLTT